jgi:hypothetical protein
VLPKNVKVIVDEPGETVESERRHVHARAHIAAAPGPMQNTGLLGSV